MPSADFMKNFPQADLDKIDVKGLENLASLAEKIERFDEMAVFMTTLANKKIEEKKPLNKEQRNQLSVAFKNVVGTKRQAWRTLTDVDNIIVDSDDDDKKDNNDLKTKYCEKVAAETEVTCLEVLKVLKDLETQESDDNDYKVFMLKMSGDYYRYLREAFPKADKKTEYYQDQCVAKYQAAMKAAEDSLEQTNPTRLGLALNYSVCMFEILGKRDEAVSIAKKAFDDAIAELDNLNDNSYKDSTLIMQLLRDNMTLWKNDATEEEQQ